MKTFTFLTTLLLALPAIMAQDPPPTDTEAVNDIVSNAQADNIDLSVLPFYDTAITEIASTYAAAADTEEAPTLKRQSRPWRRAAPTTIDVHTHVVPSWYKSLVPVTGGNPTPDWDLPAHLAFMNSMGISNSIIGFSAPSANVFPGQKGMTVALARLINEQTAAYVAAYPTKLAFYAVVPLPYTAEAITEATYALTHLGAVGIFLQSNYEGKYLGHPQFTPFFNAVNNLGSRQILYIHPGTPWLTQNNQLVEANPTTYPSGIIEFYFETARTLTDLTLTQTIHNFTNIHYVIPHVGGAFPSVLDRMLKTAPALYASSLNIYSTRFWWDSAGPTYFHQVSGLLGYGIPKSQLLFGTDFPYAPSFVQQPSMGAVQTTPLLTAAEKQGVFLNNAKTLFGNKLSAWR